MDDGLVLTKIKVGRCGRKVLILVVVDDGLVHEFDFIDAANAFAVLILVVVDDGLVLYGVWCVGLQGFMS